MKILITGGTGFLGKATAIRLSSLGHSVKVIGRNANAGAELQKKGVQFIRADLLESERIAEACRGQDQVIHCAALAAPWGKYQDFFDANVIGTKNVIGGCLKHGVSRLVNVSTPSLYFDYRHRENIREADPLPQKQATSYAATKLLADKEVEKAATRGLPTIGIRPRAIFGPGDRTVLGRLIRAAQTGSVPLINGGRSLVDMTYIDNVVDALLLCVDAPDTALGRVFNITNGEPIATRQMLDLLFSNLGIRVRYRNLPFAVAHFMASAMEATHLALNRKGEPALTRYAVGLMSRSQTLDISEAKATLGYRPKVALEEGFSRFAQWWNANS